MDPTDLDRLACRVLIVTYFDELLEENERSHSCPRHR